MEKDLTMIKSEIGKSYVTLDIQHVYKKVPKYISNQEIRNYLGPKQITPESENLEESKLYRRIFEEITEGYQKKNYIPELFRFQDFLDFLVLRSYSESNLSLNYPQLELKLSTT